MKKKQVISMIIAAILFIVICSSSMLMNFLGSAMPKADSLSDEVITPATDYVARIDICGEMTSSNAAGYLSTDTITYNHTFLVNYIKQLQNDDNNVGILLYVDSPGGAVTMADDLYLTLMDYKETERPIYCYFSDTACSGAYYAAMAADEIYANRMTTTGSIGVIISTYNLSGLFEKYGVEEVIIKSAENKGTGSMGVPWTQEQLDIYQKIIDEYYGYFVDVIVEGRGMDRSEVLKLADGREYTATQALDNGLIDGIARYEEYETKVMSHFAGNVELFYGQKSESLFSSFLGEMKTQQPKSELEIFQQIMENTESGVPMYESAH